MRRLDFIAASAGLFGCALAYVAALDGAEVPSFEARAERARALEAELAEAVTSLGGAFERCQSLALTASEDGEQTLAAGPQAELADACWAAAPGAIFWG
ncbi:MAG: hypothetical protein ACK41C_11525 [Phenylobacterium sp.]|uniref:hypothetical protein n=1 Tax=Phenylobacterium sp. TaxID=1871053 RepID=UPI003919D582